jgi:hypothetical protein
MGGPARDVAQSGASAWDGLRAVLAAGASFSHHVQGGGIWPDGAGMPDLQPETSSSATSHGDYLAGRGNDRDGLDPRGLVDEGRSALWERWPVRYIAATRWPKHSAPEEKGG